MRKHLIYIFILSLSFSSFSQSQYPYTEFGVKGGVNFSQIAYPIPINLYPHIGNTFGIAFKHVEERFLGIQLELNYTEKGSFEKEIFENGDINLMHKRTMTYVEIPILSHFNFDFKHFALFINIGPYIALLQDYNIDSMFNSSSPQDYQLMSASPYLIDNGLMIGTGFNIPTSIGTIQLEGRFMNGLLDLYNLNNNDLFMSAIHQGTQISASYLFSFKRRPKKKEGINKNKGQKGDNK